MGDDAQHVMGYDAQHVMGYDAQHVMGDDGGEDAVFYSFVGNGDVAVFGDGGR